MWVCGHIHQPEMRSIETAKGNIIYLNSGDWIENLTALEYNEGEWKLFRFAESGIAPDAADEEDNDGSAARLFSEMVEEFKLPQT